MGIIIVQQPGLNLDPVALRKCRHMRGLKIELQRLVGDRLLHHRIQREEHEKVRLIRRFLHAQVHDGRVIQQMLRHIQ